MTQNHFDAIVVGVGTMGSATASFLASRGFKVLGLEQYKIVHDNGSHAGQSRIIRKAYFEHPDYVPLLHRSYENWKALEGSENMKIYHETGIVYFGKHNSVTINGLRTSADLYNIPINSVAATQYPQFKIPLDFESLFEPEAGFLSPELAIATYVRQAAALGAEIRTDEKVLDWKQVGSRLEVKTNSNHYTCDKLIFTAGSWTKKLLPDLTTNLQVTRQVLAWLQPTDIDSFRSPNFPCWFIEDDRGIFYGFPYQDETPQSPYQGLKVALHKKGFITDPDNVKRDVTDADLDDIRYVTSKYIPDAGVDITTTRTCLYTYSPDENFIIDHLPGFEGKVTIACGFSGHGFKFASVVGEILADLSMKGKTELPIEFLQLKRFKA